MIPPSNLIEFLSTYRGQTHYRVLAGPLKGERISVRPLAKEWYEKDYRSGLTYGVWRNDDEEYARNVLSSVGLVCCPGRIILADIVAEINRLEVPNREANPEAHSGVLVGGVWIDGHGWEPAANIVMQFGDNLETFTCKYEAEQWFGKPWAKENPDVLPDEVWEEDNDGETIQEFYPHRANGRVALLDGAGTLAYLQNMESIVVDGRNAAASGAPLQNPYQEDLLAQAAFELGCKGYVCLHAREDGQEFGIDVTGEHYQSVMPSDLADESSLHAHFSDAYSYVSEQIHLHSDQEQPGPSI